MSSHCDSDLDEDYDVSDCEITAAAATCSRPQSQHKSQQQKVQPKPQQQIKVQQEVKKQQNQKPQYKQKKIGSHPITAIDLYNQNAITKLGFTGIPSIAAQHTALESGSIQFDCGFMPREIGLKKLLVLITHFHSDHGSDVCNCLDHTHGERVTIFVPAYCAKNLFNKIKCDMSMQKGRQYTDFEIAKMVRIVGCKRDNGEFANIDYIYSDEHNIMPDRPTELIFDRNTLVIAELINMGDQIWVKLHNKEEVIVEPFQCYHTVDTCGYVVYEVCKNFSDTLIMENNSYVDVNLTEDQPIKKKKMKKYVSDADCEDDHYENKYADVIEFSQRHGVEIRAEIVDNIVSPKYTLKVRRLNFPKGMKLKTMNEHGVCILIKDDFDFLNKHKISLNTNKIIPKTMFFGDTCSYVFHDKHKRIHELLSIVETVIIESTFLEKRSEMSDDTYKKRSEHRHMFLFELYRIFKLYPKTKFLLIHFSARYTIEKINKYISETSKQFKNVVGFY
jgi:ribonuclease BN (tRNA processing enzyme)